MTEEPLFSYALDLRISSPTHTEGSLCLLLFRNFDLFDFSFPNSEYIASCAKNCKSNDFDYCTHDKDMQNTNLIHMVLTSCVNYLHPVLSDAYIAWF